MNSNTEETNGGKHSRLGLRFDLCDPLAEMAKARILAEGVEKYGEDPQWKRIPVHIHLNHALYHIHQWLRGESESGEDHLAHAYCRMMFAVGLEKARTAKDDPTGF